MNGKRSHNLRVFSNFLSFLAIVIVAILVAVSYFLGTTSNISLILLKVAKVLTYSVIALSSLWYAMSKRNIVYKIIWLICVASVFVFTFI